jgi:hypothetical protein
MATIPHSTLLFDNVNKLLTTFIPAHSRRDSNQLYASIGVKSHGTITCTKKKKQQSYFYFISSFFVFKVPDNKSNRAEFIRIPPEANVAHVKELLNRLWCNGVGYLRFFFWETNILLFSVHHLSYR